MLRRSLPAIALASIMAAATPGAAVAQPANETLRARADSIHVRDYCRIATQTLASPQIRTALRDDSTPAALARVSICDPLVADFSLLDLLGAEPVSLASVARVHTGGHAIRTRTVFDAMREFRSIVQGPEVRPVRRAQLGDSLEQALTRVVETAQSVFTLQARDAALARLARYERKLGPTSAKLNGVETLLNYAAQRFVPLFRPSPTRGPSPLELVASYVPVYATIADDRATAVSASEFGVRVYLFGDAFGREGFAGIVRPSYWSAGALVTSDRNGALVWPWDDRTRTGVYLSWGALKVGYVPGRDGAVVVSRQLQVIPFVF